MIAIVNYGVGNLDSVLRAFRKAEARAVLTSRPEDIERAEGIVLPGVGSFGEAMENLDRLGLRAALNRKVIEEQTPTLGICLGFQMFTRHSEEGDADGLGWVDGETKRFRFDDAQTRLKIPHLGWNDVARCNYSPLFDDVPADTAFYFAHSYYVTCQDERVVAGKTDYGEQYVSALQQGNLFGTQFHPEKSHAGGLKVIANFVKYCRHV